MTKQNQIAVVVKNAVRPHCRKLWKRQPKMGTVLEFEREQFQPSKKPQLFAAVASIKYIFKSIFVVLLNNDCMYVTLFIK